MKYPQYPKNNKPIIYVINNGDEEGSWPVESIAYKTQIEAELRILELEKENPFGNFSIWEFEVKDYEYK